MRVFRNIPESPTIVYQGFVKHPLLSSGCPRLVGVAVRIVVRVAVCLLVVSVLVREDQLEDEGEEEEDAGIVSLHANPELACN